MTKRVYPLITLSFILPLLAPYASGQAYTELAGLAPAETAEIPAAAEPARLPPPDINTSSVREITALDAGDMAAATAEQRLAMLRTLIKHSNPAVSDEDDWRQQETEEAIYRLFESAPDAVAFDSMFYHVRRLRLSGAVSNYRRIEKLARRHLAATVPGDWAGLGAYTDSVTGSASAGLNSIDFLVDGDVLPEAAAALDAARESIHIEVYQMVGDEIGWALAKKLAAKAKEGVKVRLLVDYYGSGVKNREEIQKIIAFLKANGAEALPNKSKRWTGSRDHRKVMVIDGRVGFTGGMNIGEHYQVTWHDQQSRIEGPAVARLQDSFMEQWGESGGVIRDRAALYPQLREVPGGYEARVVYHRGNEDRNIKAMYLRAFHTAQRSIRASVPYFADPDIVDALSAAARRGVRVQLILPAANNKGIAMKSSRSFYPQLIKAGVEVYEYQGRMAHQKVVSIDGLWSSFGSSNLDSRSLKNNHELNVTVLDARLAETINTELFDVDLPQSRRIEKYKPSITEHIAGHLYPWL